VGNSQGFAGGLAEFDNSRSMQCRAFGAHAAFASYPGLTAGPGHWRPFGPVPGNRFGTGQETSAEGAQEARPGRQAGIGGSGRMSAEGAAQNRFERFTKQAYRFAGGY
jgi:hypothetical protein